MLVKQMASLVRDMANLTDSYEALRGTTTDDATNLRQEQKTQQMQQDKTAEDVKQLQLQLKHSVIESEATSRYLVTHFSASVNLNRH